MQFLCRVKPAFFLRKNAPKYLFWCIYFSPRPCGNDLRAEDARRIRIRLARACQDKMRGYAGHMLPPCSFFLVPTRKKPKKLPTCSITSIVMFDSKRVNSLRSNNTRLCCCLTNIDCSFSQRSDLFLFSLQCDGSTLSNNCR